MRIWIFKILFSLFFVCDAVAIENILSPPVRDNLEENQNKSIQKIYKDQNEWKQLLIDLKSRQKIRIDRPDEKNDRLKLIIDGPGTSGGGNTSQNEFFYLGNQLFRDFKNLGIQSPDLQLAEKSFQKIRETQDLFFIHAELYLNNDEKSAINDYAAFAIVFNEFKWNQSSFSQKRHLILHELLGLSRAFDISVDDSKYLISDGLMEKLEKSNQKNFLQNADYPNHFKAPEILKFNAASVGKVSFDSESCVNTVDDGPAVNLSASLSGTPAEQKFRIYFAIFCRRANNEVYSHIEGKDDVDVFDVTSSNILEMNNSFGSFLMGWLSGRDFRIKSPVTQLTVLEKTDGSFLFEFRFRLNPNSKLERVDAVLKPRDP